MLIVPVALKNKSTSLGPREELCRHNEEIKFLFFFWEKHIFPKLIYNLQASGVGDVEQQGRMLVERGDPMIQDEGRLEKEPFGVLDKAGPEEEAPTRAS